MVGVTNGLRDLAGSQNRCFHDFVLVDSWILFCAC